MRKVEILSQAIAESAPDACEVDDIGDHGHYYSIPLINHPDVVARAIVSALGITRGMVDTLNCLYSAFIGAGMNDDEIVAMLSAIDALTALLDLAGLEENR